MILAVGAMISGVIAQAYDFYALNDDGVVMYYTILDECSVEVARNSSKVYSGDIVIPEKVINSSTGTEYTVTGIGQKAFYNATITSISYPTTITESKADAFYGCSSLSKVYITDLDNWSQIGNYDSFSSPLGYGATLMYKNALLTGLDDLTESITKISSYAFQNCTFLSEVKLPSTIESIEDGAFNGCSGIKKVTIPANTTRLGEGVFVGCKGLKTLVIEDAETTLNIGLYKSDTASYYFKDCPLSTVYLGRLLLWDVSSSLTSMMPFKTTLDNAIVNYADEGIFAAFYRAENIYAGPRMAGDYIHASGILATNFYLFTNDATSPVKCKADNVYVIDANNAPEITNSTSNAKTYNLVDVSGLTSGNSYEYGTNFLENATFTNNVESMELESPAVVSNLSAGIHSEGLTLRLYNDIWSTEIAYPLNYTITQAPLTIMANNVSRQYGEENPEFTALYLGLQYDDTEDSLSQKPSFATQADVTSVPGQYQIIPYSAKASNYSLTYVNGTLTITKASNELTWGQE